MPKGKPVNPKISYTNRKDTMNGDKLSGPHNSLADAEFERDKPGGDYANYPVVAIKQTIEIEVSVKGPPPI